LLLVAGFLSRGVWRGNLLPAYASWRHQSQLEATHTAEAMQINEALKPLGLDVGNGKRAATCHLDMAVAWRTSIFCFTADSLGKQKVFATIPEATDNSVKQVQLAMERNGWRGGIEAGGGLLLYYDKSVNGFDCSLQLWTGTVEKSIFPRLYCRQSYYYLGNPYSAL
jgi:hypothetical protein